MHGREGEDERNRRWHMWPASAPATAAEEAPAHSTPLAVEAATSSNRSLSDSFLKDGRRIHTGDCALFLAGKLPPFIGIIRWFSPGKDKHLKLGVNWLYRPSDVNLAKGTLLEAAPNEVFYSFHRDAISAESLLHPCKVAFLRKGVELPSGISSFVCRRVYDTTNKCLWWLTDQDYLNDQQEEVNQLLDKTQLEMHAGLQPGGRSPKPLSCPPSTQLLKPGSDSGPNNNTTFSSQAKGKKRGEKGDQGSESIKQECSSKTDDRDSGNFIVDSMIKTEIAKITDKGGLINNDAVQKLVQLMQLDRGERKIDRAGRVLLADVITATDRDDCLVRFVQLRGVPLLDDWLQEAHKGKNGDGSSPREGDKSVEELLLALLRALDKLPVNLNALKACNIGKSVNRLRGHKNSEIQKKARILVDVWKKRVYAELTKLHMARHNDAKSAGSSPVVSGPGKPGLSGVSSGGNKRAASSEVTVKNSATQPSTCKSLPVKIGHGDSIMKVNPAPSGSPKLSSSLPTSVAVGAKDRQTKAGGSSGTAELPMTTKSIKQEKGNSSSQSQNNSQSCSSDHVKTVGSSNKEDTRSLTAGSITSGKTSSGSSHQRKSSNGFAANGISGTQKDTGLGKLSCQSWSTPFEKASQSNERTFDLPTAEHGSHRLIVRFPNPVRSPSRSVSGSSPEEPSVTGSRQSSPGTSEKLEHVDCRVKAKADICRANIAADVKMELWQNDGVKCVAGSDDGGRSPTDLVDEHGEGTDENGKVDASKAAYSPIAKSSFLAEPKSGKSFKASLSSISALIESIKYSEASVPVFSGDDLGMNLLASVAAGEMSKSDLASPAGSPGENSPVAEDACTVDEVKPKILSDDAVVTQSPRHTEKSAEVYFEKHGAISVPSNAQGEVQENDDDHMADSFPDSKSVDPLLENKPTVEQKEQYPVSAEASCNTEPSTKSENKSNDVAAVVSTPLLTSPREIKADQSDDCSVNLLGGKRNTGGAVTDGSPEGKRKARSPSSDGNGNESVNLVPEKTTESAIPLAGGSDVDHFVSNSRKHEKESVEESSCPSAKVNVAEEGSYDAISSEQLRGVITVCPEDENKSLDNAMVASDCACTCPEIVEGSRKQRSGVMTAKSELELSDHEKLDDVNCAGPLVDDKICSSVFSTANGTVENFNRKEIDEQHMSSLSRHEVPPMGMTCEDEQCGKFNGCFYEAEADKKSEAECPVKAPSVPMSSAAKLKLDLNERFTSDDGNTVPPVISPVLGCSSVLHLTNMSHFTVSPMSHSSPVSVTVAAPAKGPFVPPETLLKIKREPGWKGTASTSAFHPAEPWKVLEMPPGTSEVQASDGAADKQCRLPLDIDLNVADESILEDIASQSDAKEKGPWFGDISNHDAHIKSSGRLDLDLNRTDESTENVVVRASIIERSEVPLLPVRSSTGGFTNGEASFLRDFDLNNGPNIDGGTGHINRGQLTTGSTVPFLSSIRMSNNELGNLSSWLPPGNSCPVVALPSFLPNRGDQPFPIGAASGVQRILGPATGSGAFGSDLYIGPPVLSSSSAMAFTPAAAFSYTGFPFSSSFPLASTSFSGGSTAYVDPASAGGPCFPAGPSPLMGSASTALASCVRPYLISLTEGSASAGSVGIRKWGWQGLDLNAGPGSVDFQGRDERLPSTSRQHSVSTSQAFAEEQAKMYQAAGGVLKRKEPEGGWDVERLTYNQRSWQ